ncbi:hypothetical protein AMATHDRAFT_148907 [Amanita thiersii Skay4041]|uniref:separase n=1 Tax=Amanita thiersii Skay4041 TaxID=703135 RepID=A0A2A9NMH5_9AGAR|nr:hypothetical protein AMATHDRAFT_148907 [Amanita thiersii Skay4041]
MATAVRKRAQTQSTVKSRSRSTTTTKKTTGTRQKITTPDELADALAENLAIGEGVRGGKGKQKAEADQQSRVEEEVSDEQKRTASMKGVNTASQALSVLVQSGWKKSAESSKSSSSFTSVLESAETVSKHLRILRSLSPDDINVERAAISVLGKLVSLEMYDFAFSAVKEMHPRLCAHLKVSTQPNHKQEQMERVYVPIPTNPPSDSTMLTITSTYLAYALSVTLQSYMKLPEDSTNKGRDDNFVHELAKIVDTVHDGGNTISNKAHATLLTWLPHLASLSSKHLNSILSHVYTALTKFCTTYTSSNVQPIQSRKPLPVPESTDATSNALFRIRMYALHCLVHVSDSVVTAATLWEQATRFGGVYVKSINSHRSVPSSSKEGLEGIQNQASRVISTAYSTFVDHIEKLPNCETLMSDKACLSFLEWWMGFARRANDLHSLNRISSLTQQKLQSSTSSSPAAMVVTPSKPDGASSRLSEQDKNNLVLRGAHICTRFAHVTTLLGMGTEAKDLIAQGPETVALLSKSASLQELLCASQPSETPVDEALRKAGDKCDRAIEKLRKAALKVLETLPASDLVSQDVRSVVVDVLQETSRLFHRHPSTGLYGRALDTCFSLARTSLVVHDPRTYDSTYKHLEQAKRLLRLDQERTDNSIDSTLDPKEFANYIRCLSGAFHNISGTLYQAGKYGAAIGFLVDGCRLGVRALSLYLALSKDSLEKETESDNNSSAEPRESDGWRQLKEQLYRRWELLGACYVKIGDRRNAHTALIEAIKTFPYEASELTDKSQHLSPNVLFDSTPALKQLANIIDRVSYMGASELLLQPKDVSLSPALQSQDTLSAPIIGAVLERQIVGLEGSRWKSGIKDVVARLLEDALAVYSSEKMPIRRARVLLRQLDFIYHGGAVELGQEAGLQIGKIVEEIESLVSLEDLDEDAELGQFCSQYRASAHLWCALHAHYRADKDQSTLVSRHAEEASTVLKKLLSDWARTGPRRSLGKAVNSPLQKAGKKLPSKRGAQSTRKVTAAAGKSRVRVTRKTAINEPVTPKAKGRAALQAIPLNAVVSPKNRAGMSESGIIFDEFDKFLTLLQTTARVLGLMALILPKVRILDVTRKICEKHLGTACDGYISASLDLAHEYVKLGKLRRASTVFNQALNTVRSGQVSDEVCSLFFLRYAEALAVLEDVPQSANVYCEAVVCAQRCVLEDKNMPTLRRIQLRVQRLERAAMAAHVFALIQYAQNEIVTALDAMLQSLRLWNRAVDCLARLNPSPTSKETDSDTNVFEVTALKEALPTTEPSQTGSKKSHRPSLGCFEWRVTEGLLSILFSLSQAYLLRGSAREAEYFAQQAHDLAVSLNAPALITRSLAKKGEILLQLCKLEDAYQCLTDAGDILANNPGIDSADVCRLRGDHSQLTANHKDAHQMYVQTTAMLEELDCAFQQFDGLALGPRKSAGMAPTDKQAKEVIVPEFLASVLRQQIWLLRDEGGDDYMALLERFMSLPYSARTKAEENALMAQLTLHNVYSRFRSDMFLSSLTESAIALPMGMTCKAKEAISPAARDLLSILDNAAKLFWASLSFVAVNGRVSDVRNATISLALISAFQTSLGKPGKGGSSVAAGLLDASSAISLGREMLEAIRYKFLDFTNMDDLEWPLLTPEGKPLQQTPKKTGRVLFDVFNPDEDGDPSETKLKEYWEFVKNKYHSSVCDTETTSYSAMQELPPNWTVVHMNITGDKSSLFVSRQRGGSAGNSPLIFCVPLKGRRENGAGEEDENHLTFDDVMKELREIIQLSDESTRAASRIAPEDVSARKNWWKERRDLDQRLKKLLENIEFCWLGAFKTVLNPAPDISSELLTELRLKLEKLFQQCLGIREHQVKPRNGHKKTGLTSQTPSQLTLDDALVECIATLSPKCQDEELEDLIYFVLDLYQFHGVPVAIAEVDITQLVVDLRTALEEHVGRLRKVKQDAKKNEDEHVFLVLGKDVQGIPWESIPVLRGRSVSRIPNLDFLLERIEFAKRERGSGGEGSTVRCDDNLQSYGAVVDARKGYYILNPSGDLARTQERFMDWVKGMEKVGWRGVVGQPPSEQQFMDALQRHDLVAYFGHGGGEQYIRSYKIRHLPRCAATMLWGCSSGALKEMGNFDRIGTPYNYMIAGCPTLVANLWDVTDKDIDTFSQSVFDKLALAGDRLNPRSQESSPKASIVTAVGKSRDVCKLRYLTGAAPVVYGIPTYL